MVTAGRRLHGLRWLLLGCLATGGCDAIIGAGDLPYPDAGAADATSGDVGTSDSGAGEAPAGDASGDTGGGGDAAGGGDVGGGDSPGDGPGSEGSSEGGPEGGGTTDASDASDASPPCTGPIVYVSQTAGLDTNPGCSSSAPKQTITAALVTAKAGGAATIEVCKGTYDEQPLTLDFAASILGSYDCTSWTRTATYGYPTFDGTNETLVRNAGQATSGDTLRVTGSVLTLSQSVDGLTIQGAASGNLSGSATAVSVRNGAALVLSNDTLVGGGTVAAGGLGSAGMYVSSLSTPLIQKNVIRGGSATSGAGAGAASCGIYADGSNGSLSILDNVIDGGSGTNPGSTGSAALILHGTTSTPTYTVHGNTITAGTGASNGASSPTFGLLVDGTASLTLDGNSIDGGGGTSGGRCGFGAQTGASGSMSVTSNRIYGGNCDIANPNGTSQDGLVVTGSPASVLIMNNMIHSGSTTTSANCAGLSFSGGVQGAIVRHNTLVSGGSTAGSKAVYVQSGTGGMEIENNILATLSVAGVALQLSCPTDAGPSQVASFRGNLLLGGLPAQTLMHFDTSCPSDVYMTVDAVTAELLALDPAATVSGDITLAPSCTTSDGGTDSGCLVTPACTSPTACLSTLFAGWDTSTLGYANLVSPAAFAGTCPPTSPSGTPVEGWPLAPTAPCAVARSTLDDHATVTTDLYGNCRNTGTPSMGAAESAADAPDGGSCGATGAPDAGPG